MTADRPTAAAQDKLPDGWTTRPLRRVARIRNGATPASGIEENWGGGVVWITPEDIGADVGNLFGRDLTESRRTLTRRGLAGCRAALVPAGSLVLSIRAPIGHVGIARTELCFNQGCKGLLPRSEVSPEYLYYALIAARPALELRGVGTTFRELSSDRLATVTLPFPPTHRDQCAIAADLDRAVGRLDDQIRSLNGGHLLRHGGLLGRMAALLLERRAALIAATMTGRLGPSRHIRYPDCTSYPSSAIAVRTACSSGSPVTVTRPPSRSTETS